jgi:transposase-like protein
VNLHACFAAVPNAETESGLNTDRLRVRCEVGPATIQTAKPFAYTIDVQSPVPVWISLANPDQGTVGDFLILSQSQSESSLALQLETIRVGPQEIPAIQIQVNAANESITLSTEPTRVEVESVVPTTFDPTKFRDLKPAFAPTPSGGRIASWVWLLVASTLAILIGLALYRRRGPSDTVLRKRWTAEIDALETQHHQQTLTLAQAHDEACQQTRQWIRQATRARGPLLPSESLATNDLLERLSERSWPPETLDRLSTLLTRNDRLKFAVDPPSPESLSSIFDDARFIINASPLDRAT